MARQLRLKKLGLPHNCLEETMQDWHLFNVDPSDQTSDPSRFWRTSSLTCFLPNSSFSCQVWGSCLWSPCFLVHYLLRTCVLSRCRSFHAPCLMVSGGVCGLGRLYPCRDYGSVNWKTMRKSQKNCYWSHWKRSWSHWRRSLKKNWKKNCCYFGSCSSWH